MRKIIVIILILIGILGFTNPAYAVLNTHAVDLDIGDYFSHADDARLSLTTDFTIECWVNPDVNFNDDARFLSQEASGDGSFEFGFGGGGGGTIVIGYTDGSNTQFSDTDDAVLTIGDWTHVAVSVVPSANDPKFYADGLPVDDTNFGTNVSSINDSGADFIVGAFRAGTLKRYNGQIDECRVWSDIRSDAEILANYNKHLTGEEEGLAAYWRFNNDSAKDYTSTTSPLSDLTEGGSPTYQDPDTGTGVPFDGTADVTGQFIFISYKLEEAVSGV